MRTSTFYAMMIVPFLTLQASAQTYDIKIKSYPDMGKSATSKQTEKTETTVKATDENGKVLKEMKMEETKDTAETITVTKKGNPRPDQFKRTFEKATETKQEKTANLPYHGRTIVFDMKDGKYQAAAEGKPALGEKELKKLISSANSKMDDEFLPKKPVKVGETWTLDVKSIAKKMTQKGDDKDDMEIDFAKSKAEGKLVKVTKKDGQQWGVMDMTLNLVVKGSKEMKFDPPAAMELKAVLETAIDGSTTAGKMSGTIKLSGNAVFEAEGKKLTMELKLNGTMSDERSAEK